VKLPPVFRTLVFITSFQKVPLFEKSQLAISPPASVPVANVCPEMHTPALLQIEQDPRQSPQYIFPLAYTGGELHLPQ
jgi:hypothetical protein